LISSLLLLFLAACFWDQDDGEKEGFWKICK
jgi:hypothetical protein